MSEQTWSRAFLPYFLKELSLIPCLMGHRFSDAGCWRAVLLQSWSQPPALPSHAENGSSPVVLVSPYNIPSPGQPLDNWKDWLEENVLGQCKYSRSKAPENTTKIFKLPYVVMHVLLKSAFYVTKIIRKTGGYTGSLIKIFEFIMILTLGIQDLLKFQKCGTHPNIAWAGHSLI